MGMFLDSKMFRLAKIQNLKPWDVPDNKLDGKRVASFRNSHIGMGNCYHMVGNDVLGLFKPKGAGEIENGPFEWN